MRKDPSNPRYTRVEIRVGPIIREVTRIEVVDQTVEVEDNMGTIDLDKTIETITFKETPEGMEDKIIEKDTEINWCNEYNRGRDRSQERTFSRS